MNIKSRARGLRRRGFLLPVLVVVVIGIIVSSVTVYAANSEYFDLKIDGKHFAYVASESDAKKTVSEIKEKYTDGVSGVTNVKIEPEITIEKNTKGFFESNVEIEGNLDELANKIISTGKINVIVERQIEKTNAIPFETVYENDAEKLTTDPEVVKNPGKKGLVLITEKVVEVNSEVKSRETVSTQELTPAVDKVVIKGTKEPNYFIWPHAGSITSYFGYRYDAPGTTDHQGIDINASYGDPVVASRAGTVTQDTGWDGGYGLCVHIDHGDGIETLYGHNSELLVSPGEKVEAGQVIAYAGLTGWTSGTHVHFEIRENGTAVNPLNYL